MTPAVENLLYMAKDSAAFLKVSERLAYSVVDRMVRVRLPEIFDTEGYPAAAAFREMRPVRGQETARAALTELEQALKDLMRRAREYPASYNATSSARGGAEAATSIPIQVKGAVQAALSVAQSISPDVKAEEETLQTAWISKNWPKGTPALAGVSGDDDTLLETYVNDAFKKGFREIRAHLIKLGHDIDEVNRVLDVKRKSLYNRLWDTAEQHREQILGKLRGTPSVRRKAPSKTVSYTEGAVVPRGRLQRMSTARISGESPDSDRVRYYEAVLRRLQPAFQPLYDKGLVDVEPLPASPKDRTALYPPIVFWVSFPSDTLAEARIVLETRSITTDTGGTRTKDVVWAILLEVPDSERTPRGWEVRYAKALDLGNFEAGTKEYRATVGENGKPYRFYGFSDLGKALDYLDELAEALDLDNIADTTKRIEQAIAEGKQFLSILPGKAKGFSGRVSNPGVPILPLAYALTSAVGLASSLHELRVALRN